jgi:Na+-transporting NADH:ubiquinone oxidoreductase subunit A
MANVLKIKKGLDINLKGKAPEVFINVGQSESYAIIPDHYAGITPKILVRPGDKVKAGTPLMIDKLHPEITFVSPTSGEVTGVNRGEKRKVLSITVQPDPQIEYEKWDVKAPDAYAPEELKALLLETGLWPYIKQRPYDRIADPAETPRDIFVAAYNSAPLAPDFGFIVKGEEDALQIGLEALAKLTPGKVYFGIKAGSSLSNRFSGVETVELSGPHPVGNVGVMINHIKPVNKGETVWTLNAADVLFIGRLFKTGTVDLKRIVALTGSEVNERGYARVISGCTIGSIADGKRIGEEKHVRLISGNVLSGVKVGSDDYLGAYDNQITAIPEGDDVDEFVGWATPGFGKYSVSRTYFTWLCGKNKEYVIDARIRGGRRAMIMSNEYDKVFPMDILPEYLLKAIIAFDIDKMENLGIYEVAPEDFALCEFVDTSKIEIQKIVRNGLDLLHKEMN